VHQEDKNHAQGGRLSISALSADFCRPSSRPLGRRRRVAKQRVRWDKCFR
jgi:hypothetical protein